MKFKPPIVVPLAKNNIASSITKKRDRRSALRSKHVTRVGYALGTDDARSQDGVAERRFSKAVTDIIDHVFGVGVSGRRPSKSADPGEVRRAGY